MRDRAKHNEQVKAAYAALPDAAKFAYRADRVAPRWGVAEKLDWQNLPPNTRCVYCGSKTNIRWDHVVPLSRQGRNHSSNTVTSCGHCNRSKSDRTPAEWFTALVSRWYRRKHWIHAQTQDDARTTPDLQQGPDSTPDDTGRPSPLEVS